MKLAAQDHRVQWLTAAPLWTAARIAAPTGPSLLTFQSDSFMEELIALLRDDPRELAGHIAKAESHRERPAGAPETWQPDKPQTLKLYQPIHGEFALVAASLVCQVPGLPDRTVKRPAENVGFVLRKLDKDGEYAWLTEPIKKWKGITLGTEGSLVKGEELLPLFPLTYTEVTRRCLYIGVIPTSGRATFQSAKDEPAAAPDAKTRFEEFRQRVIDPLQSLLKVGAGSPVEQSLFWLLDFAELLKTHNIMPIDVLPAGETNTLGALLHTVTFGPSGTTLFQALKDVSADWERVTGESQPLSTLTYHVQTLLGRLDLAALADRLNFALEHAEPPKPSAAPAILMQDPHDGAHYIVRCVYQRPTCRPPHDDIVSVASVPFTIAAYFDPDAPTRPLRIALPADTSVKGLRKFARSVGFLTSAPLRKQICSVSNFKDALEGKTSNCDEPNVAVIWKFSLPIITLCAFVMLIAMVSVLNIAFWWLPFFRTAEVVKK